MRWDDIWTWIYTLVIQQFAIENGHRIVDLPSNSMVIFHRFLVNVYQRVYRLIEGSLEVKLPTIWRDEKQSREEAERNERLEERRVEEKE